MVRFSCSACLLACGEYVVVVGCLTLDYSQTSVKNFLSNCGLLYVRRYVRIPKETIQRLRKMFALCVGAVLTIKTAHVSLEYRSAISHIY